MDGSGEVVYLTGSHTWSSLVDIGPTDPPQPFDFRAYLQFLEAYGHNFIRLWTAETATKNVNLGTPASKPYLHRVAPLCWARTGPGIALDGKPKFDLNRFDESFFERLENRVEMARQKDIYVSIMLFNGWGLQFSAGDWQSHPFHPANNVQGISTESGRTSRHYNPEVHMLGNVTSFQEKYVHHVVDRVNRFDNVLYEICNETASEATPWQHHMVSLILDYQQLKPKQHPVGLTSPVGGVESEFFFSNSADWISPNHWTYPGRQEPDGPLDRMWGIFSERFDYRFNPPPSDGRKVIVTDTDHLWGIGGTQAWVWKSFLRGLNPIFMDPYDGIVWDNRFDPRWEPIRRSMGYTRRFAKRVDLTRMVPSGELCSTGYCLANPGHEYLSYLPEGNTVSIDLAGSNGSFSVEWFDPNIGRFRNAESVSGDFRGEFKSPFSADAVLYIYRLGLDRPRTLRSLPIFPVEIGTRPNTQ